MDKAKKNRDNVKKYLANPENKAKIYRTRALTKLKKGESVRASTLKKYGILKEALEKYPSLVTGYKPDKNPVPAPAKVDVKQFFLK